MIEKINNNPIQQFIKPVQPDAQNKTPNDITSESASASVSCDKLIAQAQKMNTENTQAVQNALKLLLSGQLDTPENIKKAAENILKFGI
ncbi:MAG: hypothetical protein PHP01_00815 [Phycisphaerae bacterium]|nr:hypothetical protein [Phycisphaerae bacterium]